jgi:hypothetical protein
MTTPVDNLNSPDVSMTPTSPTNHPSSHHSALNAVSLPPSTPRTQSARNHNPLLDEAHVNVLGAATGNHRRGMLRSLSSPFSYFFPATSDSSVVEDTSLHNNIRHGNIHGPSRRASSSVERNHSNDVENNDESSAENDIEATPLLRQEETYIPRVESGVVPPTTTTSPAAAQLPPQGDDTGICYIIFIIVLIMVLSVLFLSMTSHSFDGITRY